MEPHAAICDFTDCYHILHRFFFLSQDSLFIQPLLAQAVHASDHSMTSFTSPITSFVIDASGTNL